jgi:AbrB family looped-hinge helix DNA binding protein
MTTAVLSTKFQIVIPKMVRETMNINSGLKFEIISYGDRIELIPIKSLKELRGSLKGINTNIKREKDRL